MEIHDVEDRLKILGGQRIEKTKISLFSSHISGVPATLPSKIGEITVPANLNGFGIAELENVSEPGRRASAKFFTASRRHGWLNRNPSTYICIKTRSAMSLMVTPVLQTHEISGWAQEVLEVNFETGMSYIASLSRSTTEGSK